jgi:hypothetical protein
MAYGVAVSVRPSEYLYTDAGKHSPHRSLSTLSYLSFPHQYDGDYILVHAVHLFPRFLSPPHRLVCPLAFYIMMDSTNNDSFGNGAPRVLHTASSDSQVDLLQTILLYAPTPRPMLDG